MDKIYDICCGIDVHKKLIVACLNHCLLKKIDSVDSVDFYPAAFYPE